jgi:hypothetical protein
VPEAANVRALTRAGREALIVHLGEGSRQRPASRAAQKLAGGLFPVILRKIRRWVALCL